MTTDQTEEKGFKIRTTEHREYLVKAKSSREAIDILEWADLRIKDERVESLAGAGLQIEEIWNGSEWIQSDESEDEEVTAGHLIFDSFLDKKAAEGFASMIRERYGRVTTVHETPEDAYSYLFSRHDVIPFRIVPPIVIVKRDPRWFEKEGGMKKEDEMRQLVREFHGEFAGT